VPNRHAANKAHENKYGKRTVKKCTKHQAVLRWLAYVTRQARDLFQLSR